MKFSLKYTLIASLSLCFILEAFTWADQTPAMQKAPANVNVDGKMTEWGDSLSMYDSKTKLNYTIANDDSDLYVVAFVSDRQLKHKIMAGGITISINSEGKKHKVYSLTYPIPDKAAFMNKSHDDDAEDMQRPSLLESTSIRVAGFKDVESDVITTSNTYGFKAAISFDDKHNLVYETAIPLKMLYLKTNKKSPGQLAINIAVNGIEKPEGGTRRGGGAEGGGIGGGGGMGGMGGGGMGGGGGHRGGGGGGHRGGGGGAGGGQSQDRSAMMETTDFWVDLALAH